MPSASPPESSSDTPLASGAGEGAAPPRERGQGAGPPGDAAASPSAGPAKASRPAADERGTGGDGVTQELGELLQLIRDRLAAPEAPDRPSRELASTIAEEVAGRVREAVRAEMETERRKETSPSGPGPRPAGPLRKLFGRAKPDQGAGSAHPARPAEDHRGPPGSPARVPLDDVAGLIDQISRRR